MTFKEETPMTDLISIILPVYNCDQWLTDTIKSVQKQTYSNFELICVDDGSTDHSLEIIKRIMASDHRIKLICEENLGLCYARNNGVSYARGSYIAFLDGDDLYAPDFLQANYDAIKKYKADVSMVNIIQNDGTNEFLWRDIKVMGNNTEVFNEYAEGNICNRVWNKLYRSELVKKVPFPEDHQYVEDAQWTPRIMEEVNRMVRIPKGYYHYIIHQGSLTHRNSRDSKWKKRLTEYVVNVLEGNTVILKYTTSKDGRQKKLRDTIEIIILGLNNQIDFNAHNLYKKISELIIKNPDIYNITTSSQRLMMEGFDKGLVIEQIKRKYYGDLLFHGESLHERLRAVKHLIK